MGKSFKRYHLTYKNRERELTGSWRHGPAQRFAPQPRADQDLVVLAAAALVPVRRVPAGARVLSDKQMFLAIHATDEYVHASRHFVGDLQARVGVKNPVPVVPRPEVELTSEEAEAERAVRLRRYWARKRRRD